MKRRVEDQEPIFAPQQQQTRRPPVQGIADSFQHRALAPAPTVIEAAADNMQPSTGIQYSLPQGYQVRRHRCVLPGQQPPERESLLCSVGSLGITFTTHQISVKFAFSGDFNVSQTGKSGFLQFLDIPENT